MTYSPAAFVETDPATLQALVRDFPLATWVVPHAGELLVNHIPFLLDTALGEHGTLVGHVARANPVWRNLGAASVAVFTGPTGYISPSWYPSKQVHGKEVPTYNYAPCMPMAWPMPWRMPTASWTS
jgi:transcriptional regulator